MIEYDVVSLTELLELYDEYELKEVFKKFSCANEKDLENFLINDAISYETQSKGRTFLCLDSEYKESNNDLKVIAYFTLGITSIDLSNFNDNKKKKIVGSFHKRAERDNFPAFLIAQLGRSDAYSHEELSGETLLLECFSVLKTAANIVGGKAVILECREHMYEKVYQKLGFKKLVNDLNSDNLYMLYQKIDFSHI